MTDAANSTPSAPATLTFADDGLIPNSVLPLLVFRAVLGGGNADAVAARFAENGWRGSWVDGIYDFHHYHSTSHEVLGVVAGAARVRFGGPEGETMQISAGDVVVIPAGVGHCNLGGEDGFTVVGAYPAGQEDWDLCRARPEDYRRARANLAKVVLPQTDPLFGSNGPLVARWGASPAAGS